MEHKKNKIYLVNYYETNFDTTGTYAYCSTKEIAREKKKQLENIIDNLHTEYWIRHKRNYKDDLSIYIQEMTYLMIGMKYPTGL